MKLKRTGFTRCLRVAILMASSTLALPILAQSDIEPAARALVEASAAKIEAAQTIRLTARHTLDPALGLGTRLDDGPLVLTLRRPNQFHVLQEAGEETRELAFDGKILCLMHPQLKHHALEELAAGSIDEFADKVDEAYGFRPPLAELLSADMASQIFLHVASATVAGVERVGWTRCDRIQFVQEGITGDIWIAKKDGLPRRYRLTFHDLEGQPTWDIRLSKWELDVAIDGSLFSRRPAEGSSQVRMARGL